eukprot:gene10406-2935_t
MFREYIAEEDTKVFENFGDSNSQPIFRLDSKKVTGSYVHGMFVARSRPVIFKSQKIGKFPSPRLWTDEYLLRKFGNQKVKVQSSRSNEFSRYTQKEYSHFETMSFSKFLKNYNSPKRTSNYFLKEDVLKRHRFLTTVPKHLRIESELFKTGIEFQMGAGGQIGILSQANQEVFVCQIKGWRKVILYDPTQTDLLYPKRNIPLESQVNPVEPDLKKFPKFEKSKPVMGRLNAGECLFVPSNWWYFDILQKGKNIALTYIYLPHSLQYAKLDTSQEIIAQFQNRYDLGLTIEVDDAEKLDEKNASLFNRLLLDVSKQLIHQKHQEAKKELTSFKVDEIRALFKVLVDLSDFQKPLKILFDSNLVDTLTEIFKIMEKLLEKGLESHTQKFVQSYLCTLYNICSNDIGKPIIGAKFIFSFIKILNVEKYPAFCRRQSSENVSMLLKDSKVNKELFFSKRNHISILKSIVGSIRNAGDFGVQANSAEILYRLYLWKKLDQNKLKKIFHDFFDDDKVIEIFVEIRRNSYFLEDVRNFLNFCNKSMKDKAKIVTFKASSIQIGTYSKNPKFVDFGETSFSCYLPFPGTNDDDLLDIEYHNIRALRLGYKSQQLIIQLYHNIDSFEEFYDANDDNQIIAIPMNSNDLLHFKNIVSPKILLERKKNRETKVSTAGVLNVSIQTQELEKNVELTEKDDVSLNEISVDLSAPNPDILVNSDFAEEKEVQKNVVLETKESQTSFDQHNISKQVQTSFLPKSTEKTPKGKTPKKYSPKKDVTPKENHPAGSVSLQKPKKNESTEYDYSPNSTKESLRSTNRRKTLPTQLPRGKKMAIKRSKLPNTDDCSTEEDEEEVKITLKQKRKSTKYQEPELSKVFQTRTDDCVSPNLFEKKSALHDWDALVNSAKSENRTPNKFKSPGNIKKLLFPEPSDVDTTYGDFLQEKEKTARKRNFENISEDEGGDFSTIFAALQKAFYMKTQKRLKLADDVSAKTAESIKQKISALKESRVNERKQLYEQYLKESKEIQEKSAAQGRKLKASYQKFNAEISQQMKNHVDLANQLIKTKNSFQEKLKHSFEKDEFEKIKLEESLEEEISKMEKNLVSIEKDNTTVRRLTDFLVSENIEI